MKLVQIATDVVLAVGTLCEPAPPSVESKASRPQSIAKRRMNESIGPTQKVRRPAAAWAIAVVLGLVAVLTLVAQSLILLADPSNLAPRAREVLASFTVLEWASLYCLHAMLLTSMFMLFRLRKSSVWLFGAYVLLGLSLSVWYAMSGEPLVPVTVTAFGTTIAILVLGYLLRLRAQGNFD